MRPETLLQSNGLSRTRSRINILELLERAIVPLSGKDICLQLKEQCDKSTVYRTLNLLFDRKVLQRIIIDHEVKYALNRASGLKSGHESDHLHFKCSVCERLICLKEIVVNDYNLPEGFVKEENQFLVIGKCDQCQ